MHRRVFAKTRAADNHSAVLLVFVNQVLNGCGIGYRTRAVDERFAAAANANLVEGDKLIDIEIYRE